MLYVLIPFNLSDSVPECDCQTFGTTASPARLAANRTWQPDARFDESSEYLDKDFALKSAALANSFAGCS